MKGGGKSNNPDERKQIVVTVESSEEKPNHREGNKDITEMHFSITSIELMEHQQEIMHDLKESLSTLSPSWCLKKHKITPYHRAKMVDWMIEVISTFCRGTECLFKSIAIMDSFLFHTHE
jgi:hypothetical protein